MSVDNHLNSDLDRRLRALGEPPHAASECMQTARPVLLEALLWSVGAVLLWAGAVIWL